MNEQLKQNGVENGKSEREELTLGKRRQLLKAGIGSGVVVATLKGRSALACSTGGTCKTPSAYGSINTSTPNKKYSCTGRTPGYWKQEQWFGQWPTPYYPTSGGGHSATLFQNVFSPASVFSGKTLLQVLETGGGGVYELGRYVVAALLNAASGKTPVVNVIQIKAMWTATCGGGYYEPTAGIKWYMQDVVQYLNSTMTA